jgi:para-nitrobenzyl esterase
VVAEPIIDGRSIPQQTWEPEAPMISADVPMIIGSCQEETTWMIGRGDPSTFGLDEAGLRSRLADNFAAPAGTVDKVVGIYRSVRPKATPSELFFQITSDRGARMNAITQAERKTRLGKAPAYMYYFTYQTPMEGGKWRAFHTAELPLVFRLVRYPDAEQVSKQLSAAWAAFARNGNPNHRGIPSWRAYNLEERPTMVFGGQKSQVENDPFGEARSIFASLPPTRRPGGR